MAHRSLPLVLIVLLVTGCADAQPSPTTPSSLVGSGPTTLPANGQADYQLGGPYDPPSGVTVVVRDSSAPPAEGMFTICYVNGFQTQPQDADFWTEDHPDLLVPTDDGFLTDPNWQDEYLLDTSTSRQRNGIAQIVNATITECARTGFDAVEIDNLDSWTRADRATMTQTTNLDLASRYIETAHAAGLAIGQKNSAEVSAAGHALGFDFAVAEECHRWDECASYTDVYGDQVIDIEYDDDLRTTFGDVCQDPRTPRMTILRDRYLVPPDDPAHVYQACPRP